MCLCVCLCVCLCLYVAVCVCVCVCRVLVVRLSLRVKGCSSWFSLFEKMRLWPTQQVQNSPCSASSGRDLSVCFFSRSQGVHRTCLAPHLGVVPDLPEAAGSQVRLGLDAEAEEAHLAVPRAQRRRPARVPPGQVLTHLHVVLWYRKAAGSRGFSMRRKLGKV